MGMGKMPKATSGTAAKIPNGTVGIPAAAKSKTVKLGKMPHIDSGKSNVSGSWGVGHAGNQVPGQSASMGTNTNKFAAGGKNSMFPRGSASPQIPGKSAGRG